MKDLQQYQLRKTLEQVRSLPAILQIVEAARGFWDQRQQQVPQKPPAGQQSPEHHLVPLPQLLRLNPAKPPWISIVPGRDHVRPQSRP
jgi:hypothetical protein